MKKRNGETETYNNSDSMEAKNDISKNNLNYSTKVIKFILQMTLLVTIAKWKVASLPHSLIFIFFPAFFLLGNRFLKTFCLKEWVIFFCLEGEWKNLRKSLALGHEWKIIWFNHLTQIHLSLKLQQQIWDILQGVSSLGFQVTQNILPWYDK